jgi:Uncharacterized protein containing caspase domain
VKAGSPFSALILSCALVLAFLSFPRPSAAASTPGQQRVALVIGNSAYENAPLRNPVNDARAMAQTLRDLGFEVIHLENASQNVMQDAIATLGRKLARGQGVGLFYFAGHGVQSDGRNYLIPVSVGIRTEADLPRLAVDAAAVLESMEAANNSLNIVILDACRNNPFAKKFRSGAARGGLAAMQAPKGSLIAFATSPGAVASDGTGGNGVYTKNLLENLRTPGIEVEQMFKRVRSGVITDTDNRQIPWETTSLQGDFMFNPAAREPQPAVAAQAAAQQVLAPAAAGGAPVAQARSQNIQVEFAMLRENGRKAPQRVNNGDTLASGDAYFFHIKASTGCSLYLFQVDSSGAVFRLFPSDRFHTAQNPVPGRRRLTLPNDGEVFYLDNTVGKEEFYFFASQEPVEALERLEDGTMEGILGAGLTLRGPAGVKAAAGKVASVGGEAQASVQEFTFSKSFVHAISINHK